MTHPQAVQEVPWAAHRSPSTTIAAIACAVSVATFFVLPYAHLFGMDFTAAGWITGLTRQDPNVAIVWIVPLLTAAAGMIALTQMGPTGRSSARLRMVRVAIGLLLPVLSGYLLDIIMVHSPGSFRVGFWLGGLTAIAAFIALGCSAASLTRHRATSAGWR